MKHDITIIPHITSYYLRKPSVRINSNKYELSLSILSIPLGPLKGISPNVNDVLFCHSMHVSMRMYCR